MALENNARPIEFHWHDLSKRKIKQKKFPPPKINGSMTEAERITSSYTDANYGLGAKMTIPLKIAMKK